MGLEGREAFIQGWQNVGLLVALWSRWTLSNSWPRGLHPGEEWFLSFQRPAGVRSPAPFLREAQISRGMSCWMSWRQKGVHLHSLRNGICLNLCIAPYKCQKCILVISDNYNLRMEEGWRHVGNNHSRKSDNYISLEVWGNTEKGKQLSKLNGKSDFLGN